MSASADHPAGVSRKRRRQRLRDNGGRLSTLDRTFLLIAAHGRCLYCDLPAAPLVLDHLQPLCLGGRTDHTNLIPSCRPCDTAKGALPPREWLAQLPAGVSGRIRGYLRRVALPLGTPLDTYRA